MDDISSELKRLLSDYHGDTKLALREEPELKYFYALSETRENLLEWYDFSPAASLLQVGSGYGALTGLYSRRVKEITVLDEDKDDLDINWMRHGVCSNIRYVEGSLDTVAGNFYDYVVMAGSLKAPFELQIKKAKALLKPGGVLILAVDNRLGLKYKAGAKPHGASLLKQEVETLLSGSGKEEVTGIKEAGTLEFYYPMPDYLLPVTVYSESRLPSKGEISHTVLAYDYPEYVRFDPGKLYDEICESGLFEAFANSFLAIWSSHEKD